tara:strand:+ start:25795 stop:25908 length:114 start_codon:yes stop_codon:yes gene_type:complete
MNLAKGQGNSFSTGRIMMHFAGDWVWWQWLMDLYSGL